jgi:hypothetical protein
MKIKDILHNNDTLINLIESYDYKPEDLTWDGDEGSFTINGERFIATVTPAKEEDEITYSYFFNPVPKVGNVDFSMVVDDETNTQDTTGVMKSSAFKVFASVARIVTELRGRHRYEILLCAAKREHSPTNFENRVRAYEVIVGRIAKNSHLSTMKLMASTNTVIYAAFNHHLYHGMLEVKEHLQKQLN